MFHNGVLSASLAKVFITKLQYHSRATQELLYILFQNTNLKHDMVVKLKGFLFLSGVHNNSTHLLYQEKSTE